MTEKKLSLALDLIGQSKFSKLLKGSASDIDGMSKSITGLSKTSKKIDSFKSLSKSALVTGREVQKTQSRIKSLAGEMKTAKRPSAALRKEFKLATAQGKKLKKSYAEQKNKLSSLRGELRSAGVDTKRLTSEQKRLGDQVKKTAKKIEQQKKKKKVKEGVRTGMAGIAAAGAGAISMRSIVNASGQVELAKGEVASLGVSEEGLARIEAVGAKLSNQFSGMNTADVVRSAYDLKSGVSSLGDDALAKTTGLAAVTAKATKSDAGTMTTLFAQGHGIYQKQFFAEQERVNENWKNLSDDQKNVAFFENFSGSIATAVQNFRTDGSKMSEAISTLGATATSAGASFSEQIAILGMLQASAKGGGESATMYKSFLANAGKANETLGLDFVGGDGQLRSTENIIGQLKGKYGEKIDDAEFQELKNALGSQEAVSFIQLLVQKSDEVLVESQKIAEAGLAGGSKAQTMAGKFDRGMSSGFTLLAQRGMNLANVIGDGVAPVVTWLTDKLGGLLLGMQDIATAMPDLTATLVTAGTVAAGVGGLYVAGKTFQKFTGINLPKFGRKKKSGSTSGGILGGAIDSVTGGTPVFVTNFPGSFGGGFDAPGSSKKSRKTRKGGAKGALKKGLARSGGLAKKGGGLLKLGLGLGKSGLKKIPGLSILAGAGFALKRAFKGDFKGGGLEMMSGLASTIPIAGTAASIALDGYLMHRDSRQDEKLAEINKVLDQTNVSSNNKANGDIIIHQTIKAEAGADKAMIEKLLSAANPQLVALIKDVVNQGNLDNRRISFGGAAIG